MNYNKKPNKLFYVLPVRFPTTKAYGYQVAKMCEAFARVGIKVEIIAPYPGREVDVFSFYGIDRIFTVNFLKVPDLVGRFGWLGRLAYYLQLLFFIKSLFNVRITSSDIVLTRSPWIAYICKKNKKAKVWLSAHGLLGPVSSFFLSRKIKLLDGIICNSMSTANFYKSLGSINVISVPNGVDFSLYEKINLTKSEIRKKYNLPSDKYIIIYVGHFYKWKGIDTILQCADLMRDDDRYMFVLVGGDNSSIGYYKNYIDDNKLFNVRLLGYRPPKQIPEILKMADLLVLPNLPITEESIYFTSPLKMFEYMASKRPIVASDLPSIREVLNENNCLFFRPGSASSLRRSIIKISTSPTLSRMLSEKAYDDVKEYTWDNRVKKILQKLL